MKDIENILKKLRIPFDSKVYSIPYAGDLFEKQARILLAEILKKIKSFPITDPTKESDEYDAGLRDMRDIIIGLIETK